VRIDVEHLESARAQHESRHHEERREREETALREPGKERTDHQQRAEDGGRLLQEVDPGSDRRHAWKLP